MANAKSCLHALAGYPLWLALGLMWLPDGSSQWQFALLLYVSLFLMVWWGHLILHNCKDDGPLIRESFFLKACIGQFALLLAWALASPVIFLARKVLDGPLLPTLAAILFLATALIAKSARSSFIESLRTGDIGRWTFLMFSAACIFKVSSYYAARAGALGLDTHQHIFFTADLYEAAYLKLTAGGTNWIERYPKGFHALAALWGLPGMGDHLGVAVKVMPSLQLLLVVFSVVELCAIWLRRANAHSLIIAGWWLLVAGGLAYILFRGTKFVYPIADLNSTGRLSSSATLFLPAVLGFMALLQRSRRITLLAAASLPLSGALALKLNPALITAFVAVSFPLWVATVGQVVLYTPGLRWTVAKAVALGSVFAAFLVVADPFYLAVLVSKSHAIATLVDDTFGLTLLPQMAIGSPVSTASLPKDLAVAIWHNLSVPEKSAAFLALPDSSMVISGKLIIAMRILTWSALGVWAIDRMISRRPFVTLQDGMPALVQVVLLFVVWANGMLGRAVAEVVGVATIEASILSTYVREFSSILVMFVLPIHFVLSATLLSGVLNRHVQKLQDIRGGALMSAGAVILLAISLRWWPIPEAPSDGALGWWQPVKEAQVDAFQSMEEVIPEDAVILAEAAAVTLNAREEWVLPVGESAAYLPFARRRYLFNVRLGDGYALSHADLNGAFCKGTPATARQFLRDHGVRFLFTVDAAGEARDHVLDRAYCGIKFSELGLVYPPYAVASGGLAIYELMPR